MLQQARRLCREHRVNGVFIHMAHRYAYRLAPAFRWQGLPVLLWYAHGSTTWHLRLAHLCVNRVISSTPEGFRIPSGKAFFIGQGVDTDLFNLRAVASEASDIITVSRISRRKRLDLLLDVMARLRGDGLRLKIIGAGLTDDDRRYESELRTRSENESLPVDFAGSVSMEKIAPFYDTALMHLNVSQTNSMDKTVLEALACGCPVLTSNPAFHELFKAHPDFIIKDDSPDAIAEQIRFVRANRGKWTPEQLRGLVIGHHDLHSHAGRIMEHLHAMVSS